MVLLNEKVWWRFERTLKDGSVKKFRIQEVPPNMYEDVWNFILKYFIPQEPITVMNGIANDPRALIRNENFWTKFVLPQNLSLLCVEDKDYDNKKPEIVGINNLLLNVKGKEHRPEGCSEPDAILRTFSVLLEGFDMYESFGITEYLGAAGLVVDPKYRGMKIGLEILLAREPLCKFYGINITETIFTAEASQVLASKAGFTTVLEKTFAELAKKLDLPVPEQFKTIKVMVKKYDFSVM